MLVMALLAASLAPGGANEGMMEPGNHWNWRGFVAGGSFLEIRGITGDISAIPSDDNRVQISATIEDGATVEMRVAETSAGVTVCAVRKGADACASEPANAPGARVDYQVRVPGGVRLVARTVNGGIQAQSLLSDVQATTVNGPVVISTTGTAEASTVNGSIVARLLKPFWSKAPQFSAVNGGISVVIPRDARTGIQAETRNGKIVKSLSAFQGAATDQKIDGTVGRGGACNPLVIRTINGAIELKQRS